MTTIRFDNLAKLTPSATVKIPALDGTTKGHVLASELVGDPVLMGLWSIGFTGTRTWVKNNDGTVTDYNSAVGSTEVQRAATVPGTNSAVWILDDAETDPVAAFELALS